MHLIYGGHSIEYRAGYASILRCKRALDENRPITELGIFNEHEKEKIKKENQNLTANYEKAGIKIDLKIEDELYQETISIVGKKRSKHGKKMAKRVKRAEAHEIVYDRFIVEAKTSESTSDIAMKV